MRTLEDIYAEINKLEKTIEGMHDNGLTGALVEKYIKCGKIGCKCSEGYRHGPYPHIQYYENGVLKTIYIKKRKMDIYQQKVQENNEFRKTIRQLVKLYRRKIQLEQRTKPT